jgi:hypothetical protein
MFGKRWKESFVPVAPGFWFSFKTVYNNKVTVVVDSVQTEVTCQPGAFSKPNDTIIWLRYELKGEVTQDFVCIYEDPAPGQPAKVYASEENNYKFWVRKVGGVTEISFCTFDRTRPEYYEFGYIDR